MTRKDFSSVPVEKLKAFNPKTHKTHLVHYTGKGSIWEVLLKSPVKKK